MNTGLVTSSNATLDDVLAQLVFMHDDLPRMMLIAVGKAVMMAGLVMMFMVMGVRMFFPKKDGLFLSFGLAAMAVSMFYCYKYEVVDAMI